MWSPRAPCSGSSSPHLARSSLGRPQIAWREELLGRALTHPGITAYRGQAYTEHGPVIALEWLDGGQAGQRLPRTLIGRRLSQDRNMLGWRILPTIRAYRADTMGIAVSAGSSTTVLVT
jgi:hypothetical protein